jgi:hypothetical protein
MSPFTVSPRGDLPMRTMVPTGRQHQEAIQFRLILAATYPFFLAAAAVNRVRPAREIARPGLAPARRSVFGEARALAVQAIPFAFMG